MKKITAALLLVLCASPALASQNSITTPTTGTVSGIALSQNINNANNTLATFFSGGSAPSSPLTYQAWVNTSASPKTFNFYDGSSWLTIGQLDTSGHNWNPQGNAASFASLNIAGNGVVSGLVGIGTAASTYQLKVVQAASNQAYFGSTGTHGSNVIIDNATAGQSGALYFQDAGASIWSLNKNAANTFSLNDVANSKIFIFATAGGDLNIGPNQTTYSHQNGHLSLGNTGDAGWFNINWDGVLYGSQYTDSNASAGSDNTLNFVRNGTQVGTISTTLSATSYATSSDKRLKENVTPLTNSGAIIDAMQPVKYDWKYIEGNPVGEGFLAQDLFSIYPLAVNQGDNGEADENGRVSKQWSVDYSKLVPVSIAEIKALRARASEDEADIAELKAQVIALQSH